MVEIEKYKPLLIAKTKNSSVVRDSNEWNCLVKSVPFILKPEIKDLPATDWKDQNGKDVYVPDTLTFKEYDIDIEFLFIGEHGTGNTQIKEFIEFLCTGGANILYDSYTKIGRQNVVYKKYDEDSLYRRDGENDIIIFKLNFTVYDPITEVELTK